MKLTLDDKIYELLEMKWMNEMGSNINDNGYYCCQEKLLLPCCKSIRFLVVSITSSSPSLHLPVTSHSDQSILRHCQPSFVLLGTGPFHSTATTFLDCLEWTIYLRGVWYK